MRRMIVLSALMTLMAVGLAWSADNSAPAAPAATKAVSTSAPNCAAAASTDSQTAKSPVTAEQKAADLAKFLDNLKAAGFVFIEKQAVDDPPPCPDIFGCGGGDHPCHASGCSTTDLGYASCSLPNGGGISCIGGKTIHVTSCNTCSRFPGTCCDVPPKCLCLNCNSGAQSFDCE